MTSEPSFEGGSLGQIAGRLLSELDQQQDGDPMRVRSTLIMMFAAAAANIAWRAHAQEGDVARGADIARTVCAACHIVVRGQAAPPNSRAPPFSMLANTPGMTSIALSAALLTSHRSMPNIILEPDERRDVIAYILSLQ